jgi:hypothetical protein
MPVPDLVARTEYQPAKPDHVPNAGVTATQSELGRGGRSRNEMRDRCALIG